MIRVAAVALSLVFATAALGQDVKPSGSDTVPVETAAPAQPAKERPKRYVNEKGETLVCKTIYGGTGSRLKQRGNMMCGTQSEWDDADSELSRYVERMTTSFVGNPKN